MRYDDYYVVVGIINTFTYILSLNITVEEDCNRRRWKHRPKKQISYTIVHIVCPRFVLLKNFMYFRGGYKGSQLRTLNKREIKSRLFNVHCTLYKIHWEISRFC